MSAIDRAALDTFISGSTPEARKALGHLLRNAVAPLILLCDLLEEENVEVELCRSLTEKLVRLIEDLTPHPSKG